MRTIKTVRTDVIGAFFDSLKVAVDECYIRSAVEQEGI